MLKPSEIAPKLMDFRRIQLIFISIQQHIEQIKKALGFGAVISTAHAWPRKEAQIDLLIDRNDDTINICEMKYSKSLYHLTEEDTLKMQYRLDLFREETGTTKSIHQTLITS